MYSATNRSVQGEYLYRTITKCRANPNTKGHESRPFSSPVDKAGGFHSEDRPRPCCKAELRAPLQFVEVRYPRIVW